MAFWKRKHWDEQFDEDYADHDDRERPIGQPPRIWPHAAAFFLIGALFVGLTWMIGGQTVFEKTILALAQPVGMLWITLMVSSYFALLLRQNLAAILGIFAWLLLTVTGNGLVTNSLALQQEAAYLDFDAEQLEPVDVIFLLGGGTTTRPNGIAQLDAAGDRIAVAARLYHAGKVTTIVCTGTQIRQTDESDMHPREEGAQILVWLGVKKEAVVQLEGKNTFDEAEHVKAYLDAHPDLQRIGVLTSAMHLARAMRLIESHGVEAIPLPADFKSGFVSLTPTVFIPSASSLEVSQQFVKEILAELVGR